MNTASPSSAKRRASLGAACSDSAVPLERAIIASLLRWGHGLQFYLLDKGWDFSVEIYL